METAAGEVVKAEQQKPGTPPKIKKRRRLKRKKFMQANGGSSSSAVVEPLLNTTPPSSSPSNDADGRGQQQQHHQQGGKKSRLVWTSELHDLFLEAYNSLGDEAVPRRILEKMNVPGITRENVASHLQKHKQIRLKEREEEQLPLGVQASASHTLRSLPTSTPLAEVSQAHLEFGQVVKTPPDCLSRNSSSIAANLEMVQSSIQQLCGPPIEVGEAQPAAETMQRAPADAASLEHNGNNCTELNVEAWAKEFLVADDEANAEAEIGMAPQAENAAEPNTAPAAGIIEQYWESPDTSISSRDLFGLPGGR